MVIKQATPSPAVKLTTEAALAGIEASIRDRAVAHLTEQRAAIAAKLTECAMDPDLAYPEPNSWRTPTKQYHEMKGRRNACQKFFVFVRLPGSGFAFKAPLTAELKPDTDQLILKEATEYAKATTAAFITKLAGKMAALLASNPAIGNVLSCRHDGDMRSGSVVTYATAGTPDRVRWATRTILNVSPLGTLFNQFPTRLLK